MERDPRQNPHGERDLGAGLTGVLAFFARAHAFGVRTAVICPGGRNAPMVQALETAREWGWEVLPFFEERSAGFFALARAKRDGRPVLVSVTSGTAAANLLPAVIEAHASDVPLLVATADRPRSHRGHGSPQSMWQKDLFGIYAKTAVDWEDGEAFPQWDWDRRSPAHVNLCHHEPLWAPHVPHVATPAAGTPPVGLPSVHADWPTLQRPLVLLGALPREERATVEAFCRWYGAPVLAEASSGLREIDHPHWLRAGERVVRRWWKRGAFDGVIRFGNVPSWRLWRDLEDWEGPVLNFGPCRWSGLPQRGIVHGSLTPWLAGWMAAGPRVGANRELGEADRANALAQQLLNEKFPRSEAALVRQLSARAKGMVYLGNSRPVRDWNEHAVHGHSWEIQENRGLNGIDGQLSAFYGHCRPGQENWALLGDLTTMYDLSAPWALRHLPGVDARLVVMNNHGGRIFERLFPDPAFVNAHATGFADWARMWHLPHQHELEGAPGQSVIELLPDGEQTRALRAELEKL